MNAYGFGITLDAAGRILTTGYSFGTNFGLDMVVWVYLGDGAPDLTFGSGGYILVNSGLSTFQDDSGLGIVVDPSGDILVSGRSDSVSMDEDLAIWRHDSSGGAVLSFGASGLVREDGTAGGGDDERAWDLVVDSSGRILATGYSFNAKGDTDMVLWRFDALGSRDGTFGTGGVVVHDGAAGGFQGDSGRGITLDALGRILVCGGSRNANGDGEMVIWRFLDDGSLDASFAGRGWVTDRDAAGRGGSDGAADVAVAPNGDIYAAGSSGPSFDRDMAVWKFFEDGSPDLTFGRLGAVTHNSAAGGDGDDSASALELDAQGRIVVAGTSEKSTQDFDMVVWRIR